MYIFNAKKFKSVFEHNCCNCGVTIPKESEHIRIVTTDKEPISRMCMECAKLSNDNKIKRIMIKPIDPR